MGEVQLEILQNILQERFGLTVAFSEGGIFYKETLTTAVEGIGHYEPLRHYAEVHLLLEPGARGSGVQLAADCPPDTLAENWQRLILASGRAHPPGVLIRCAADRCERSRWRRAVPTRSIPKAGTSARRPTAPCGRACGWPSEGRRAAVGAVV